MADYVVTITFPEDSVAYEAFTELGNSPVGSVVVAGAVVERNPDGSIRVAAGGDSRSGIGFTSGSLIGLLVGVLGGPFGMLLGWGLGAAVGAGVDADRAADEDDAIDRISQLIPPGSTAIVAETKEEDLDALGAFVARYNGFIDRRPLDDVLAELEGEQQARSDAAEAARATLRAERKKERHEHRDERIAKLTAAFDGGRGGREDHTLN